jgi:REP element-mobilizing transposase RayT
LNKIIREKKHRLDKNLYVGEKIVSFTICIKDKSNFFISDKIFKTFEEILLDELNNFGCDAIIYLFMPNHIHLITQGKNESADCLELMKMFKQKTGYDASQNYSTHIWQKDFHDHIIRDDENLENAVYYILNNPIRAGLTDDWKKYKYKGSTIYNFDEWK